MQRFLKTVHILARIFLYLSVIGVLLLYFFRPQSMSLLERYMPPAGEGAWLALTTTLSVAAVMFAAAELAYKSLRDNEFMISLASSVLRPAYGRYDLSDRRFSRTAKGEFDFNASLRDVTDGRERVMYELAWEKQHSKNLEKKTVGNKVVILFFFVAGLLFFCYPIVVYLMTRLPMSLPTGTAMDYFSLVATLLAVIIILEIGNNQAQVRRLNTIMSVRNRSDDLAEKPSLPPLRPEPVYAPAPAPAPVSSYDPPKPASVPTAPASVAAEPASAPAPAPAEPAEQESWTPEPAWTGVPEDAQESSTTSPFVNLTPEDGEDEVI